ncbi:MAG TPA: hypothetical protein VJT09_06875 [Pyrinomonadaceae bacterium]|nr:hypothetical protein [Pyrinomonadaceae bacterium]
MSERYPEDTQTSGGPTPTGQTGETEPLGEKSGNAPGATDSTSELAGEVTKNDTP